MFYIIIRTSFVGFHLWSAAPAGQVYLRNVHRHVFHVEFKKKVKHEDRDIEFIQLKKEIDDYCTEVWANKTFRNSCEQIARDLCDTFKGSSVQVMEDNENGALWVEDE